MPPSFPTEELPAVWRLLPAARTFVPGLAGEFGAPHDGDIVPGGDNAPALRRLSAAIAAQAPEAGAGYWALRSWNMLEWQPALLSVLAVHRLGIAPRVDRIALRPNGAAIAGFRLPEAADGGETDALIALAASRLRRVAGLLLADLQRVSTVKPLLAWRLLADRLLSGLAMLNASGSGPTARQALAYADRWLAAMALQGASALRIVTLSDGREQAVLDRRACCLAFRTRTGAYCPSCPKLPEPQRLALQRDWREAHVRPA